MALDMLIEEVVKSTFCGELSNNVVSLDCGHVSSTTEEFYTVRCQVSEMRSLDQSLEEVCVVDMLEGDLQELSGSERKLIAELEAGKEVYLDRDLWTNITIT